MSRLRYLALAICLSSGSAEAVKREDVLECGLPDGSKFILRSSYEWSPIPLPMGHNSRESNRVAWGAYQGLSGKEVPVPASVDCKGKSKLSEACAYVGDQS
jgi:hypothetical protein